MPHTIPDWFCLLGCTTFVWIVARLIIKGLYRLVRWLIRKIEDQKQNEDYTDDSDNSEANDSR